MVLAKKGIIDIVKYLITVGGNINAQDNYKATALHYAVINDQPEIVLKNHSKIDIVDNNGQTHLSLAKKKTKITILF